MCIAEIVTSVMTEMKSIHMLDSDLNHFTPEEFRHDFHFGILVLPLITVNNWVMGFSPFNVFVVKRFGKSHFFTYDTCIFTKMRFVRKWEKCCLKGASRCQNTTKHK